MTTIQKYSPIEAGLEALKSRHLNVIIDVTTKEGMLAARAGRSELRNVRLELEKARKEEKEESLAYGKKVDEEAKKIQAVLSPMEEAYDRAIKAEEKRIDDEKQAILRAAQEAEAAKVRAEKEAEEKRMADERAKLKKQEEELFALEKRMQAEQDEKDRQAKALIDEANSKLAEAQKKIEEAERASRERIELAERESRLKLEAENKKIREIEEAKEREAQKILEQNAAAVRAEQAKKDAAARAEQEKKEATERAIRKAQALIQDGRGHLLSFCRTYGDQVEFTEVTNSILAFLNKEEAAATI